MLFKKPISKADDDRLSRLIQMKRQEKPDAAFWDKFDEELRSKQLAALVRTQTWYERLGKLSILLARKSAAATAAVCIFALGIFTISKTELFSGLQSDPETLSVGISEVDNFVSSPEQPMFVVEETSLPSGSNENEFAYSITAAPTYEVNALTKKSAPVSYQILAEPKRFTAGGSDTDSSLGAKIIRTGNQF